MHQTILEKYFEITKTNESWVCSSCYSPPFDCLPQDAFFKQMDVYSKHDKHCENTENYNNYCKVCQKSVRNKKKQKKLIPCHSCKSLIHKKCSNIPLVDLMNFDADKFKIWECSYCVANKFPFSTINDIEIYRLSFNSLFSCECLETITAEKLNFKRFEYSSIFGNNNSFKPDSDNNIDNLFDLKSDFDYYVYHQFHKLIHKLPTKQKNNFSLLHTNTQSLNHNFEQIQIKQNIWNQH